MKRPFLVLLSIAATIAFGAWLVRTPNTQREILLACAGWVLGFWVAAAIQSRRRARGATADEDPAEDEWDEWDESEPDEEWDDGDGEEWDDGDDRP